MAQASTTASTTTVNSTDPIVLSGAEFYQGGADHDDEYGCVVCHGVNGTSGTFQAIDRFEAGKCPSCSDVDTLALDIAASMPSR